jgi:signal transduction histidine kinase
VDLLLLDARGELLASSGRPLPPMMRFPMPPMRPGFMQGPAGPSWVMALPDGRTLVAHVGPRGGRHPAIALIAFLSLVALAVALCAYPVVRGLTRRIERLQAGVETLGRGDLSARVSVKGRDEVAKLADSFNNAAAHIEELVDAHRLLLANASHELRTPLSRLRMGLEFVKDVDPLRRAALEQDIAELDHLVGEILLASRLDAMRDLDVREPVDLLGLVAEEGARVPGCDVSGVSALVMGDPALLRRLVRNLLDNAAKHGRPPILARVATSGEGAEAQVHLTVLDAGDGIPPDQRANVFTPFWRKPGSAEGTGWGLGLSLVRQIARRHGGEARVLDEATGGTAFDVVLPQVAPPALRGGSQGDQDAPGVSLNTAPLSQ